MKKKINHTKIAQPPKDALVEGSFFTNVYDVARKIPKGRVTSYGAIANYLGAKKSARMVGWALSVCHGEKPAVPAHRVVNRVGLLSGKHHFAEINQMEKLLLKESVKVENDVVVDFEKKFWDPAIALKL